VIAAQAVHAAFRGIVENIFPEHSLADFFCDVLLFWKWLARGFIFCGFDAEKKTEVATFADVRMRFEW